jgi:hypothetical protein
MENDENDMPIKMGYSPMFFSNAIDDAETYDPTS